jgi:hypothetical protein
MAKRWATQGHLQFDVECDIVQYENIVETTMGIHLQNLVGENNLLSVQNPSQKDHLQINATYVIIPI